MIEATLLKPREVFSAKHYGTDIQMSSIVIGSGMYTLEQVEAFISHLQEMVAEGRKLDNEYHQLTGR